MNNTRPVVKILKAYLEDVQGCDDQMVNEKLIALRDVLLGRFGFPGDESESLEYKTKKLQKAKLKSEAN